MTEEQTTQTISLPPDSFNLFRAVADDKFKCCFCRDEIGTGDCYLMVFVGSKKRRAHWPCVMRCITGVVEKRDERGVSEDL